MQALNMWFYCSALLLIDLLGKTRGSLLFEMTESQLQAAAVTKAQRERHLINSATDMVAKEDWVRSAMEWPEHQCVGFTKEKARPDYGQTKTPVAESRRYTIAGAITPAATDDAPEAPPREVKPRAGRRASSPAVALRCGSTSKPVYRARETEARPSCGNLSVHSSVKSAPGVATDLSSQCHHGGCTAGRPGSSSGADNDALDKELPPRAAPLQTAPGHLDVNNMALDGKAGGTATRPAPHRIGSDPLPQPRRSDTSQSLGRNKVNFVTHQTGKTSNSPERKQSRPPIIVFLQLASGTLPQLGASAKLQAQPHRHPRSSACPSLPRREDERRSRTSAGVTQLPSSSYSPPSASRRLATESLAKHGNRAKPLGPRGAAAGAKGHLHCGRAQHALPAIGGICGSALSMGAR
mmetsp:Transcript_27497/g.69306  ORF Transcript_27497/g.69306 Transcript_27497/m.69306 type:complete len:409 (-) Transcript_27497:145-1371(-)